MNLKREPKLKGLEKEAYLILKKEGELSAWTLIEDLKVNKRKADQILQSLLKKGVTKLKEEEK